MCSVLASPLYLSHFPNIQNTWRVHLREGQAGPVGGQLKVNPPTKLMIPWAELPMGGTLLRMGSLLVGVGEASASPPYDITNLVTNEKRLV